MNKMPFQSQAATRSLSYPRVLGCLVGLFAAGCATPPAATPARATGEGDLTKSQLIEMRTQLINLTGRLESLETRLGSMNDKVNAASAGMENLLANKKSFPTAVTPHPSEGSGTHPVVPTAPADPEAGFVTDDAVQSFRQGSILLAAQKYPEAILAFSSFLEKYPDHPMAGSAQFYIGDAYFRQKEFKLSLREFERVLTSYDRSPHVADTLREMADAEEHLKLTEQSARHRQLLTSLFPQSPAAAFTDAPKKSETPQHEAPAEGALDLPPTAPIGAPGTP